MLIELSNKILKTNCKQFLFFGLCVSLIQYIWINNFHLCIIAPPGEAIAKPRGGSSSAVHEAGRKNREIFVSFVRQCFCKLIRNNFFRPGEQVSFRLQCFRKLIWNKIFRPGEQTTNRISQRKHVTVNLEFLN